MKAATFALLVGAAAAQECCSTHLNKPALTDNLDYLEQGQIDNLHPTGSHWDQWGAGYIPQDCKSIAQNENMNPSDFEVYNVHYDDCPDAWVLCRHKDSAVDLVTSIDVFGRLPARFRSWNRHFLTLPGNNFAYNSNGNVAFFGTTAANMDVMIHETGHSLDLQGAYPDGQLSSSQVWYDNYNQDSNVPDNYAGTNQVENVAQNTVVAMYDKVVPNGFGGAQPAWNNIFHQYATLQWKAGDNIIPGGTCNRHLKDSAPVPMSGSAKIRSTEGVDLPFVKSWVGNYTNIVEGKEFSTRETCKEAFFNKH